MGISTVLKPVVCGAFVLMTWRWAFYINLIIGVVFAPVILFLLPYLTVYWANHSRRGSMVSNSSGAILSIAALITHVMGINFSGTLYVWSSGQIVALFVVSGVLFVLLAIHGSETERNGRG